MDDERYKQAAVKLICAIASSTDDMAAKRGEADPLVQIKRNSDRLRACDRHEFDPVPDWRTRPGPLIWQTVHCARCGGDMKAGEANDYLRGFAHGSGQDYTAIVNAIWPPDVAP